MVKRIIPGNMSPWECEINDVKYVYPPGTEQMVPDEVAHVIDAWYASQEPKYPEPVQPEGGGGGGSNVLGEDGVILQKHLPAGYPYASYTTLMPETTLAGGEGLFMIQQSIGLIAGQNYDVVWNGTAYTCQAIVYEEDGSALGVAIGDTDMVTTGESSGEYPFVIVEMVPELVDGGVYGMALAIDGSSSAVVSISGEAIHPIDTKYLPEMNNNNHNHFVEIDLQVNSNMTITVANSSMTFSDITSLADEDKPTVAIARVNGVPGSPFYFFLDSCSDVAIDFHRIRPDGDALDFEKIQAMNDGTWSYTKKRYLMTAAP